MRSVQYRNMYFLMDNTKYWSPQRPSISVLCRYQFLYHHMFIICNCLTWSPQMMIYTSVTHPHMTANDFFWFLSLCHIHKFIDTQLRKWLVGISLFCFYFHYFSFWQLFFLTYYVQGFARSFNILLKVKLYS